MRLSDRFPAETAASFERLLAPLRDAIVDAGGDPVRDTAAVRELAMGTMHRFLVERRTPSPADVEHVVRFALAGLTASIAKGARAMERELLITGIGGQGVQLAGQVLARAATLEGRYVMLFGLYGGMMRGGNTDGTVVIGDEPLLTPPIVSRSWSAIAMHDEFWAPIEPKLRPGALVLVNDATFTHEIAAPCEVHRVDATGIATELGHPLGGSMVMAGAYAGDHRDRRRRRARRGDARIDPVVPHAAHRRQRTRDPPGSTVSVPAPSPRGPRARCATEEAGCP